MIRNAICAAVALTISTPSSAEETEAEKPATVVVAFDRETVGPLIVEGVRNKDSMEPVEANDPVRVASISKMIMALATLRLVDEGKVDLEADVSDYLGFKVRSPHFPDAKVTLTQLLSHRAGLRDKAGYIIPLGESLEEKLKDPEAWTTEAAPGEAAFEYANLGSPVVATALEAATGERYDRLLERTVFKPLGVEACLNWIGCSDEMVAMAVALYRDSGEPARDFPDDLPPNCSFPVAEGVECSLDDYVPGTNASVFSPQGGVRVGMKGLAKIGQRLMLANDGDFLSSDALFTLGHSVFASSHKDQEFFCSYAFGLQMIERKDSDCVDDLFDSGESWFGHAGEAYGLRSGIWWNGSGKFGFAYFTTAVPPRQGAEDQGGFSELEIALMKRAQELLATKESK